LTAPKCRRIFLPDQFSGNVILRRYQITLWILVSPMPLTLLSKQNGTSILRDAGDQFVSQCWLNPELASSNANSQGPFRLCH
jgi:hypothetical protein